MNKRIAALFLCLPLLAAAGTAGEVGSRARRSAPAGASGGIDDRLLDDILSRPRYERWRSLSPSGDEGPGALSRFAERFGNWWRSLWEKKEPHTPRPEPVARTRGTSGPAIGSGLFNALGWCILAGGALFLLNSLITAYRERGARPTRTRPRTAMARALTDGDALAYDDGDWAKEAERRAEHGDFRHAYRALYLGLLSGLHEKGAIVFSPKRTNWQHVLGYRAESGRDRFAGLTEAFDRVWYGRETPDSAENGDVWRGGLARFSRDADLLLGKGSDHA
ncbi:MAG: hypothetical protein LBJ46_11545 [Planctomycetota bacterium]|jgi:hypothetical protein|nr:hypothetical protein [Planctomycetota bacterium]